MAYVRVRYKRFTPRCFLPITGAVQCIKHMVRRTFPHLYRLRCFLLFLTLYGTASGQKISPPRIWNDKDLKEWATPVATLDIRPAYYSERDYYSAREAEWVRTYPVYSPGANP
jgi:hypothetical protein